MFAGLLLPAGAIGDRYGRKGALLTGLGVFIAGAVWSSQSGDPTMLIIARASMGIGAALIMPATLSIIVSVFPTHERAKAIAIWAGFAGAGGAIGIIGGGALLEKFWWGSVFFVNVPIAIVAGLLIMAFVPTSRDAAKTPLDPIGSALSIAGLGSLVFAIIEGGEAGWTSGSTVGWFVAAAVLLSGWILWERRTEHPMLDPRLFRRAPFSLGSLTISAAFAVMFGMFFLITQYFQFAQGHSPLQAGVRNLPFALTMIVVAPRSPALADRLGKRGVIVAGFALQTVGFLVLAQLKVDTPFIFAGVGIALLAAGMALLMPAASEAIVSSLPPSKAGVGSAWNDSTREIGGAIGIAVMGTLLSSGYQSGVDDAVTALPPDLADIARDGIGGAFRVAAEANLPELIEPAQIAFVDGMRLAFYVAAATGLIVATIVALRYPPKGAEPAPAVEPDSS